MLGRVRWLMKTDEFMGWVQALDSRILLVDGHLDMSPAIRLTPMSVFNSTLISSLISNPSCIALFFFAGLHNETDEFTSGPCAMMRYLITQLFLNPKLPHSDLRILNETRIQACEEGDICALCALFEELLLQSPPDLQVICILDGLACYEEHPFWDEELDYITAMFEHLCQVGEYQGPVLKVLMTFSHHSLQVAGRLAGLSYACCVSLAAGHVNQFSYNGALPKYYEVAANGLNESRV